MLVDQKAEASPSDAGGGMGGGMGRETDSVGGGPGTAAGAPPAGTELAEVAAERGPGPSGVAGGAAALSHEAARDWSIKHVGPRVLSIYPFFLKGQRGGAL